MSSACRSKRLRFFAEYIVLRLIICLIQMSPLSWSESLANKLAYLLNDVLRVRNKVVDENLRHVFPEKSRAERKNLSRDMWRHLVLMVIEMAHAPRKIHDSNWHHYIYVRDKKVMTEYFMDWRPVVLVSGHFGHFEMAVYSSGVMGIPTYAIARPLDNPWLQRWIREFRESRGQFILPSFGSASKVQEVLDAGGMLSLLGDQHAGTKGCWIDFLGRPASCHKALALFTLTGKAPMIVTYAVRRQRPLNFEIGCNGIADPLTLNDDLRDVKSLTQWYNLRLEELIREDPDQYWWVHRRWKEKPVRQTKKRRAQQAELAAKPAQPTRSCNKAA